MHSARPFHSNWQRLIGLSRWRRVLNMGVLTVLSALLIILPAASQQPIELSFLMVAPEVPALRSLVAEFEQQNPGVRLNMVEGPNASNLLEDLNTSTFLLGSAPYDLVYMDVVWVPKFAAAGWLLDLSDRVSDAERSQFLQGDIEAGLIDGRLYRIPWRTDAGMLYYRTDLLQQLGAAPPTTFDELMQTSQAAQQAGLVDWGYVWQGKQYEGVSAMFVEVLEGFGGFWVDPDTQEIGLDRPEAIAAVEFLYNTIQAGVSPPGVTTYQEEEARRLFQNGKTLFMRNWPYAVPLMNSTGSAIRDKFAIQPMVTTPNGRNGACLGGWGWGIASTSEHADAAWKAVQFFTSEAVVKRFVLDTGYLPSRRSLFSDPEVVQKYPYFPQVFAVVGTTTLRPPIPQYAQASDILQRYLSAAFSGRMAPEDAMRAASRETRSLLGQPRSAQEAEG